MLTKHPEWLMKKAPAPSVLAEMKAMLDGLSLSTVCESAECPNQGECFTHGTATFLILGDICTRNCGFCAVKKGYPLPINPLEPGNVALAVLKLGLAHAVITSVTRDDLSDGGSRHFAGTIEATRQANPRTTIEVLIPDFQGSLEALRIIVNSSPQIINHNVETVPRLYPEARPQADYDRSLNLLRKVKSLSGEILTKSGIMVGLGESHEEVVAVMKDLRTTGCDSLTIGQYLSPSPRHHDLVKYITPQEFMEYKKIAEEIGFRAVASGPFVRSSFHATNLYEETLKRLI